MPRARSSPPKSVKFRGQPCPISFNNFKETDHAEMVPGRGIAARNGGRHRAGDRPIDPRRARIARCSGFGRGHRGKRRSHGGARSEEHTSELQSLMRISYAVFCLKKKTTCNTRAVRTKEHETNI